MSHIPTPYHTNTVEMNVLDLPDEMLLAIFNQCNAVSALYTFTDLHPRLDRIVCDPLFVRHLNFTVRFPNGQICPAQGQIIDRVVDIILSSIKDHITKLTLEPYTMERVLTASIDYRSLSSLSLLNFHRKTIVQHLTENTKLIEVMNERVTHFDVSIVDGVEAAEEDELCASDAFQLVLSSCRGLIDLSFGQRRLCLTRAYLFGRLLPSCCSSTLTKLDVLVDSFTDCQLLLDGRFECLSTCVMFIEEITAGLLKMTRNTKALSRLKSFSLTSHALTEHYDDLIVPFLRLMCNVEELTLFLGIRRMNCNDFIDGTRIENDFITYLSQLRKFQFSIHTSLIDRETFVDRPSNVEVQRSFTRSIFGHVGSYVEHYPERSHSSCHVYSLPFAFCIFMRLNRSFPGGTFNGVRILNVAGWKSLDYELFKRIATDFPYLERLTLPNSLPESDQPIPNTNINTLPVILFPRLKYLYIHRSHVEHVELLISDQFTRLPRLRELHVGYDKLSLLTNNFTDDVARVNCSKIRILHVEECFVPPKTFSLYFPSLDFLKK